MSFFVLLILPIGNYDEISTIQQKRFLDMQTLKILKYFNKENQYLVTVSVNHLAIRALYYCIRISIKVGKCNSIIKSFMITKEYY